MLFQAAAFAAAGSATQAASAAPPGAGRAAAPTPESDALSWLRAQCVAAARAGAMGGDWEAVAHVAASELLSARPSDEAAGAFAAFAFTCVLSV